MFHSVIRPCKRRPHPAILRTEGTSAATPLEAEENMADNDRHVIVKKMVFAEYVQWFQWRFDWLKKYRVRDDDFSMH